MWVRYSGKDAPGVVVSGNQQWVIRVGGGLCPPYAYVKMMP